jgi:hypothetical protein
MSAPIVTHHDISLFDLEAGLVDLVDELDECQTEEERATCTALIREWLSREVRKVDSVRAYIRHAETMAQAAMEEANRQLERSRAWTARLDRVKAMVVSVMGSFGLKKLEGRTGELRVQNNGGKAPLNITDESLIPDELWRYEGWIHAPLFDLLREGMYKTAKPGMMRDPLPWSMKRVPDIEAIRKVLEAKCLYCDGSGVVFDHNAPVLQQIPCPQCDGTGHPIVAGAHLAGRGCHLRVK